MASSETTDAGTASPEPRGVGEEPRRERVGRHARRARLYLWAALLIVALILLVVLVAQNTQRVRVGWVFGHSRISLVYLVLFATILGWALGVASSVIFRRRTRRQLSS